jgi:hypothetical protein
MPVYIYEKLSKTSVSYGWSERRRYDLCRIWITIVYAFGDNVEKYMEYAEKAADLVGTFAFPN